MGQGQEILARRYLQQTMLSGGWLLLQNAHLGLDYLEEFHESKFKILNRKFLLLFVALTATDHIDPSFRVYVYYCFYFKH